MENDNYDDLEINTKDHLVVRLKRKRKPRAA
jgi:hypothetical protein